VPRLGPALAQAILIAALVASCAQRPRPIAPPVPPAVPRPEAPATPPPAETFELSGEPFVDVGLAVDEDSLVIVPSRKVFIEGPRPGNVIQVGTADPLVFRVGEPGNSLRPRRSLAMEIYLRPGDTLWVGDRSPRPLWEESSLSWKSKSWRGRFKVFVSPRGKMTLADRLPLETYLVGVVPGEIGGLGDALLEAGRAQAVAARSYTLFYRGRRGAEGFDLYGTVEDQVYGPIDSERPLATRCVEGTSGLVALDGGWPIRANYCSTCGGITADVWEAWPADPLGYLVSRRDRQDGADLCAASPQYRWHEEWSVEEFAANLVRFGPSFGVALPPRGVGEILDVRVAARSRSGRVWRLTVATTTGEITIPSYVLRQVLRRPGIGVGVGSAILRSNLFKIDVRRDRTTRRALVVVATGAGSGHGVGLCQTGALGMARAKMSADEILKHYYQGIEIRRLY
jgi:stage II sporulation protein D